MEILQKVFKTLSDPTRVRVLALLEQEELAVQELMDVLDMAQSRVSRHLAILREAGLLQDRREGTHVFYRFAISDSGPWRDAWNLVRATTAEDPRIRHVNAIAQRWLR
jgi:DNA-binding transcriptional ArsR family regulator